MAIRVGFIGAGLIANYHRGMLQSGDADVVWSGVYDVDTERAVAFSTATGAPLRRNEDDVLDNCDAVYVCTWTSEHRHCVESAAERGIAVFCEKPLSVDLAGAVAMETAAARAGIVNQVGLVLRFSPAMNWLRHLVTNGDGGRVMSIVFRDDQYIPIQGMYGSTWRGDRHRAGAGTLIEHSIHDVDLLEFICGPITSVTARSSNFHALDGIEDTFAAAMAFEAGAVGTLASIWHDVLERPSMRQIEVFTERMWCRQEGSDWYGPVRWCRTGSAEEELGGDELVERVYRHGLSSPNPDAQFIECVRDHRPASPDFATAVRAHAVVDALYRSAADEGAPTLVTDPLGQSLSG
jgi:predicted dehydrogenase